jgi:hypothetical protein
MQYEYMMSWQQVVLSVLTKRKSSPNIDDVRTVGDESHSSPVVNSNGLTYTIMVSVRTKDTTDIYNHTLPHYAIPVRLTLHGQWCIRYENTFMSCRRSPQDIPRPPRLSCVVVASHMIDTQPLPHNRDFPQASIVLRGHVRDSYHPMGGNTIEIVVVASL